MARLIRIAVLLQKCLIVACSLLIAATFGVVVVLRYGFEMNLFAYEEWMLVTAFILYFLGAAQGSHDNTHIKADLLREWIKSEALKRKLDLFVIGLEIGIGAVLSWWGFLMVVDDLARYPDLPATPVYGIPLAVPRGVICLGFVLMTVHAAMRFLRLLDKSCSTAGNQTRSEAP